jgi:hypothetical protein
MIGMGTGYCGLGSVRVNNFGFWIADFGLTG